jgi:hypothetical protein
MEAWTDERLDDLAATLRPLPVEVAKIAEAVDRLTAEVKTMREESGNDSRDLRGDLAQSQRQITQIGWGLVVAFVGMVGALIIALL